VAIIAFRSRPCPMLYQIPSFLLDVIVGLLGGACLLRLYLL
jgi:YggT family protein